MIDSLAREVSARNKAIMAEITNAQLIPSHRGGVHDDRRRTPLKRPRNTRIGWCGCKK
jgi:hypothetical protein